MGSFIVARRVILQIYNDKRSLALLFIAPMVVMFLLYTVLMSATTKPVICTIHAPEKFQKKLEEQNVIVHKVEKSETAHQQMLQGKCDAYLSFQGNAVSIFIEGSDPSITKLIMTNIQKALLKALPFALPDPKIQFLYGSKDFKFFDSFAPMLMGFFIFFFVFVISGIAFVRERISGTLDRLLATPLRREEIVFGYFLSFGFFVSIQTVILQVFTIYVLGVEIMGSFYLALFLNLLIATVSLSLGLFLSAFARNEFQLFQFIPVVIVPQILFSGLFDLREAAGWVQILSSLFPLTYAASALRNVMIKGCGISQIYVEILVLFGYAVFFLFLNTVALKKYREA